MVAQKSLEGLRAELVAERDGLRRQLEDLGVSGDGSLSFDEGFADSGQVAAEQGETRMLAATLTEQLRDVERALDKLDEGQYGRCEECGAEIAQPRLEAMPATRYCIQHA
jgi:RNA polymerase-binding transcription factor DksA